MDDLKVSYLEQDWTTGLSTKDSLSPKCTMYTIACSNLHHMLTAIERIKTHNTYLRGWNLEPKTSYDK